MHHDFILFERINMFLSLKMHIFFAKANDIYSEKSNRNYS